jgi:hypothetical protein
MFRVVCWFCKHSDDVLHVAHYCSLIAHSISQQKNAKHNAVVDAASYYAFSVINRRFILTPEYLLYYSTPYPVLYTHSVASVLTYRPRTPRVSKRDFRNVLIDSSLCFPCSLHVFHVTFFMSYRFVWSGPRVTPAI